MTPHRIANVDLDIWERQFVSTTIKLVAGIEIAPWECVETPDAADVVLVNVETRRGAAFLKRHAEAAPTARPVVVPCVRREAGDSPTGELGLGRPVVYAELIALLRQLDAELRETKSRSRPASPVTAHSPAPETAAPPSLTPVPPEQGPADSAAVLTEAGTSIGAGAEAVVESEADPLADDETGLEAQTRVEGGIEADLAAAAETRDEAEIEADLAAAAMSEGEADAPADIEIEAAARSQAEADAEADIESGLPAATVDVDVEAPARPRVDAEIEADLVAAAIRERVADAPVDFDLGAVAQTRVDTETEADLAALAKSEGEADATADVDVEAPARTRVESEIEASLEAAAVTEIEAAANEAGAGLAAGSEAGSVAAIEPRTKAGADTDDLAEAPDSAASTGRYLAACARPAKRFFEETRFAGVLKQALGKSYVTEIRHAIWPTVTIYPMFHMYTATADPLDQIKMFRASALQFVSRRVDLDTVTDAWGGADSQPVWKLFYAAYMYGSEGRLLPHGDHNDRLHLTAVPDLDQVPHDDEHRRLAEYMADHSPNLAKIVQETQISIETVIDFCNACEAIGLLERMSATGRPGTVVALRDPVQTTAEPQLPRRTPAARAQQSITAWLERLLHSFR